MPEAIESAELQKSFNGHQYVMHTRFFLLFLGKRHRLWDSSPGSPALRVGETQSQLFSYADVLGSKWDNGLRRSPPMGSLALLQSLKESVLAQANVKAIYGEPVSAQEKTIIPVAKIMYGYGAGAGSGGVGETKPRGEGGGGGGGVRAVPVGVVEVSKEGTRFVSITDRKKLAGTLLAGIGLGVLLARRRRH